MAAAQQRSDGLGGGKGVCGSFGTVQLWRWRKRGRYCSGSIAAGSAVVAVQRQWQRSGGNSALVLAAWRQRHCGGGSVAAAVAVQWRRLVNSVISKNNT